MATPNPYEPTPQHSIDPTLLLADTILKAIGAQPEPEKMRYVPIEGSIEGPGLSGSPTGYSTTPGLGFQGGTSVGGSTDAPPGAGGYSSRPAAGGSSGSGGAGGGGGGGGGGLPFGGSGGSSAGAAGAGGGAAAGGGGGPAGAIGPGGWDAALPGAAGAAPAASAAAGGFGAGDWIGLAGNVISGVTDYMGAQKQADAQAKGQKLTEQARIQAMKQLESQAIWSILQWLFPGMVQPPASTGGAAAPGTFPVSGMQGTPAPQFRPGAGPVQFRAQGGPVYPGQPTVVGEQGPELLVPSQPGTVMPNPESLQAGAPAPTGQANALPATASGQPGRTAVQQPMPTDPGTLVTGWTSTLLGQPGAVSPIQYERQQEQANQSLNAALYGIQGGLSGQGVDPASGLGKSLEQGAVAQNAYARQQAARDLALIQEAAWRQDIAQGSKMYNDSLALALGLSQMRSAAAAGQGFPMIQNPVDPYGGIGTGIGLMSYYLSDYFTKNPYLGSQPGPG